MLGTPPTPSNSLHALNWHELNLGLIDFMDFRSRIYCSKRWTSYISTVSLCAVPGLVILLETVVLADIDDDLSLVVTHAETSEREVRHHPKVSFLQEFFLVPRCNSCPSRYFPRGLRCIALRWGLFGQ